MTCAQKKRGKKQAYLCIIVISKGCIWESDLKMKCFLGITCIEGDVRTVNPALS